MTAADTSTGPLLKALEAEDGVVAAEAEGVGDGRADLSFPGLVGDVVQIALGIRFLVVDGRRPQRRPLLQAL